MAALLTGQPVAPIPAIPGRLHVCADVELTVDEIAQITSPRELALCLGVDITEARRLIRARTAKGPKP